MVVFVLDETKLDASLKNAYFGLKDRPNNNICHVLSIMMHARAVLYYVASQ